MYDVLIAGDDSEKLAELADLLSTHASLACQVCKNEDVVKQAILGLHDFIVIADNDFGAVKKNTSHIRNYKDSCSVIALADSHSPSNICCTLAELNCDYLFRWQDNTINLAANILNVYCDRQKINKNASTYDHETPRNEWQFSIEIKHNQITGRDYIQDFASILLLHTHIIPHIKILQTIIAELLNNAVDHGLLQLDSKDKLSSSGFENYYRNKDIAIQNLDNGTVTLSLRHFAHESGNMLSIKVSDSGSGFDYKAIDTSKPHSPHNPFGRGISLVHELCKSVEYSGNGSNVEVTYAL